jgi:hypothetical protein
MSGRFKAFTGAVLMAVVGLLIAPQSWADTITFPFAYCHVSGGCGSGSLGSVTVSSVPNATNEVSVTLTLGSGDVLQFGGAGEPLLFDVNGDPATPPLTASPITDNVNETFAFNNSPMTMADGTGKWNYFISCTSCGPGTSMSTTGPNGADVTLSFDLTLAGGTLSPSSFGPSTKGFLFATDVGIPNGSGGYNTGDIAAVPLPSTAILLISALVACLALTRRRPQLVSIARELRG